jgi:hypothetical protein
MTFEVTNKKFFPWNINQSTGINIILVQF